MCEVSPIGKKGMGSAAARGLINSITITSLGAVVGEERHTLTLAEAPTGQFTLNFNDPGHDHELTPTGNAGLQNNGGGTISRTGINADVHYEAVSNTTGITASITDHASGGAYNNVQPSSVVNFIIKT